jgi:hypothetical protein
VSFINLHAATVDPAVLAQAGSIAKTALDFVGQHGRGYQVAAARVVSFADCEHRCKVIARMRRLQ